MDWFNKVKVWWKRHVVPGLSGRVEELEKQFKELGDFEEQMVANQKQSDARITELEAKLQEQIMRTERVERLLRAYIITLGDNMQESNPKMKATSRGLKSSLKKKLNKDSEREESEATLRVQKKMQGSNAIAIMENIQGVYTEVKQVGNDWKIAKKIKLLRGRMRRQNPVRGQEEIRETNDKANQELTENGQGVCTEVKKMRSDWKIAGKIKHLRGRMRRQNPGPNQANERPA
jgi:uncharacterized protein (UPF0335 family)